MFIYVRRQPNDYKIGKIKFEDVTDLDWGMTTGGIKVQTNQYYIFGYIYCNQVLEGEIAHSCMHGPAPHHIRVCVLKKDNDKKLYNSIIDVIGESPNKLVYSERKECKAAIIELMKDYKQRTRVEIFNHESLKKFGNDMILSGVKYYVRKGVIKQSQLESDKRYNAFKLKNL